MYEITVSWAWLWWSIMVAFNFAQLIVGLRYILLLRPRLSIPRDSYNQSMMILGSIFTVVAAYRSVFVSRYLMQFAWFDTIANSSLIIRTFAFFAEISFALLFALAMLKFERDLPSQSLNGRVSRVLRIGPCVLVSCLLLAQFFAYGGLIIKSRLSFAIEETLWSVGFISILPLALHQLKRIWSKREQEFSALRISTIIIALWCVVYSIYSLAFHLPLEYWSSAIEQLYTNVPPLKTEWSAVYDALVEVNVTRNLKDWGFGFTFWHTSYFTVCVWISLVLMRAPQKRRL